MDSSTLVAAFLTLWIVTGLVTGVWMVRRGHKALWVLIAVVLGPLFVPIALERAERGSRLARSGPGGPPMPRAEPPAGPRILIGMDGSSESDHALATATELFGRTCEILVLAEVVCFEATEETSHAELDAASARLAAAAADLESRSIPVSFEVLAGPPGKTLRCFAEQQQIDLIVVGRRGRGLTGRLMGSVSADLVQHSMLPVLVVEPSRVAPDRAPAAGGAP
ncbi:universal stress protein [Mycolicibacterium sp. jd]|uniref:universal stress protein n=1 Tax=unclassified Mycolicibacterium TaxID=2636767 RepID=UPI00351B0E85